MREIDGIPMNSIDSSYRVGGSRLPRKWLSPEREQVFYVLVIFFAVPRARAAFETHLEYGGIHGNSIDFSHPLLPPYTFGSVLRISRNP